VRNTPHTQRFVPAALGHAQPPRAGAREAGECWSVRPVGGASGATTLQHNSCAEGCAFAASGAAPGVARAAGTPGLSQQRGREAVPTVLTPVLVLMHHHVIYPAHERQDRNVLPHRPRGSAPSQRLARMGAARMTRVSASPECPLKLGARMEGVDLSAPRPSTVGCFTTNVEAGGAALVSRATARNAMVPC